MHLNKILFDINICSFRKLRTYQVPETGVPLNAMMVPQGYMITVCRFITNIFYEYRRCMNFVRVSQTQTTTTLT